MKRVFILGISGSGKSTLAKIIGKYLEHPIHHLDTYFWGPGWSMPEAENWDATIKRLSSTERWVIDGNFSTTYPTLMSRADTICFLDFSVYAALYRVCMRTLKMGQKPRDDGPKDCPDRINWEFIHYIWRFHSDRRPAIVAALEKHRANKTVIVVKNQAELSTLVQNKFER